MSDSRRKQYQQPPVNPDKPTTSKGARRVWDRQRFTIGGRRRRQERQRQQG